MAYTDIDDPSAYFQTALFTGNGGTNAITNTGNSDLQPDWIWFKCRSASEHHGLFDSVRTVTKGMYSNLDNAEDNLADSLASFNSNGFTMGADTGSGGAFNGSGKTNVAWQWKAGTAFSNSAGANSATIASTGSVNTDAGFSIISYTGNGNDNDTAKIAHGLGVAANMIIVKCRNAAGGWQTSSTSLGFNNVLQLNATSAQASGTYAFGRTGVAPTSTVFTVSATSGGNHTNTNNNTYIAYCFAEKQGYSKFGSYTGNGNADGTFVYTGFKPAMVIYKKSSGTENWFIHDNKRQGFNPENELLFPNLSNAEGTVNRIDLLSNGFKATTSDGGINGSGATYIYMAFAENPFTSSAGTPVTAR